MRLSWLSHGVVGCAGIVIGAVLMSFWGQHPPISPAPPSPGGEPVVATRVDTVVIDSGIRQVIREELARHDALVGEAPEQAAPSPAISTVPSPDAVAQTARANAVLDAAINRLSWTEEDASQFRSLIGTLPAAERQALMHKFGQAVNDRGMRLETGGPPF
jgi:hypothetical protein